MRVLDATFLKTAVGRDSWPPADLPEVAFAGRSNVGKSSLINALVGRRALARVSSTPGRTRALNFIDVTLSMGQSRRQLRLADLPGYGWARVSQSERRKWAPMIEGYLKGRDRLALAVLLVDARHDPSELDRTMAEWIVAAGRPAVCVATKLDKLGKDKRGSTLRRLSAELGVEVLGFSSVTGEGKDALWRVITEHGWPEEPAQP